MNIFGWILRRKNQTRRRVELQFVSYAEAEILLLQGWNIAKEEDNNHIIGIVFLERTEPLK